MLASPTPPSAFVIPGPIDYHGALNDGLVTVEMTIQVFVGRTTDLGCQKTLNTYLKSDGPTSVKAVLEAPDEGRPTPRLGGLCSDLIVTATTGYGIYKSPDGSGEVLGAEWVVKVFV